MTIHRSACFFLSVLALLAQACSGGGTPTPTVITVTIDPASVALETGSQQTFTATVTGSSNASVTWSVGEASGGSVTSAGVYTAPGAAGTFHVIATSAADPTKSATATLAVTLAPQAAVTITPTSRALHTGETLQFAAAVTNSADSNVTWSVKEGASGGSVSSAGLYTAPSTAGAYHVVATLSAKPSVFAIADVFVSAPVAVTISPTSATLLVGGTQQFAAAVTETTNTAVTWSVQEGAGGTVTATGLYTAPVVAGSFHIISTSVADPSKTATATVTVAAPVAVTVSPTSATLLVGGTKQFTAAVTGAANTAVTWSVQEGAGGTVSAVGLYLAPAAAGNYHVVATSAADPTKSAAATVTVNPLPVAVSLNPPSATLLTGGTLKFIASVSNAANTAVTWSVQEGSVGGAVTAAGVYTAPGSEGTFHLVATSAQDPARSATAVVAVSFPAVAVTVTPSSAKLTAGSTQQFVASVANAANGSVVWSLAEGSAGGLVSAAGLYTAPLAGGTFHVVATSVGNGAKSATATVVSNAVVLNLSPLVGSLNPGSTQQFIATVKGSANGAVTWSVTEGAAGGTVSASGLYSAPAAVGSFHVVATSVADNTQSSSAAVSVVSGPSVDAAGGTVTSADPGVSIAVPQGALDSATVITVAATTQAPPPALNALSPVYQFEPDGKVFARPLTISLPLPAGVTDASIYWSRLDGSGFDAIGGTIANGKITAQVPHFSQALIGPPSTTRTVTGVGQVTWISATTRTSVANDYSNLVIEALVDDGQGHVTAYPGAGSAQGTFTIPNVPVGKYMLHTGTSYVVTDSNAPDLGTLDGGRPPSLQLAYTGKSVLNMSLSGLAPWTTNDFLEFASSQANDWDFYTEGYASSTVGSTSVEVPFEVSASNGALGKWVIRGSQGDQAFIAQEQQITNAQGTVYQAMTRVGVLPSFDSPPVGAVSVAVSMQPIAGNHSISVDLRGTQWKGALQDGNPQLIFDTQPTFAVVAQAGQAEDGFYGSNADMVTYTASATSTDLVTGPMSYASVTDLPGANWGYFAILQVSGRVKNLLPGTVRAGGSNDGLGSGAQWVTTLGTAASSPIVMPLSVPRTPTVAGQPLYAGGTGIGTTPILTWAAPALGTAAFYKVTIFKFTTNPTGLTTSSTNVSTILTTETSLALPAGLLLANTHYAFLIIAVGSTSPQGAALLASAPHKTGLDLAEASTVSGVFNTTAAPAMLLAPTTVAAVKSGTKALLSWDAQAGVSYVIRRGTVSGTYTQTFGSTNNTFTDAAPVGKTYYYVVTTASGAAVSAKSAEVSIAL